jgi:hypothetical protein
LIVQLQFTCKDDNRPQEAESLPRGDEVADKIVDGADQKLRKLSDRSLYAMLVALLLTGGIMLDMNRINGVRDTLDRVARLAASEAMASNRPTERQHICEKRLNKGIWTNTEVNLEDVDITVEDNARIKTATVSYDVTVNLVVGRFFGLDEVVISGEVETEAPSSNSVASLP